MTFTIGQLRADVEFQRKNVQQALDMWESSALALIQGLVQGRYPAATGIKYVVDPNDDLEFSVWLDAVTFRDGTQLSGIEVEISSDEMVDEGILYELLNRCPEYRDITELEFE